MAAYTPSHFPLCVCVCLCVCVLLCVAVAVAVGLVGAAAFVVFAVDVVCCFFFVASRNIAVLVDVVFAAVVVNIAVAIVALKRDSCPRPMVK